MKRGWTLALLGLLAFIVLLVATLPAKVLVDRIPFIAATNVGGSLWSGRADSLSVQGMPLGRAEWRLSALSLLLGRIEIDARVEPPQGSGSAHCVVTLKQVVTCSRVQGSLPLQNIGITSLPQGWSGRLSADLQQLKLEQGWPVAIAGKIDVQNVENATPTGPRPFGSFNVEFPAASGDTGAGLTGVLKDTGGPLNVDGKIHLQPDHTYLVEGRVAARADASPELTRSLEYLGAPDAQGLREFSLSGSL